MADDLIQLEQDVDTAIPIGGGTASVKTVKHNPLEKKIIKTLGRNTGLPFTAKRSPVGGVIEVGCLYWNGNAMNKSNPTFSITVSGRTMDGNNTARVLELIVSGVIHFKDYKGRSVFLKYLGASPGTDTAGNDYFEVYVQGYAENTNYSYQPGDEVLCFVEVWGTVATAPVEVYKTEKIIPDLSYSLVAEDFLHKLVFTANADPGTYVDVTLSPNIGQDGYQTSVRQAGSAVVRFLAGSGVTVEKSDLDTLEAAAKGSIIGIDCNSATKYNVYGQLKRV